MILKRRILILCAVFFLIFIYLLSYCIKVLTNVQKSESEVIIHEDTIQDILLKEVGKLESKYKLRQKWNDSIVDTFLRHLKTRTNLNVEEIWKIADNSVSHTRFYDYNNSNLGNIVRGLKTAKITVADADPRGTQLKLLLTLQGGQQVVFKPRWYPEEKIIDGPVYAGKDRYGSEILSFYLSPILDKHLIPVATTRTISLRHDVAPVAKERLKKTIFQDSNGQTCLYGKCFYCRKEDPICDDKGDTLVGAIILNIKRNFYTHRSPWQRTYKKGKSAAWELNNEFCKILKGKIKPNRLLDLIDTSIFDFLIQNGDRHHYETFQDNIILIDNGKGLGNPNIHHLDILAPLYQCCIIRENTWKRLQSLSGGFLKESLEKMPDIYDFVTENHLRAIENRLLIVFATVEYCKRQNMDGWLSRP